MSDIQDKVILDLNEIAADIVNRPEIPKLLRTDFDVSFIAVPSKQDEDLYEIIKYLLSVTRKEVKRGINE